MAFDIDGHIALDKGLKTTAEKACVLAEELGHHYTSYGNMIDMNNLYKIRKQERQARLQGYNRMIGLCGYYRNSKPDVKIDLKLRNIYMLQKNTCKRLLTVIPGNMANMLL